MAPRANQKLAFKYYGPFQVIARVGSAAYKLELPPSSAIHPIFHVSQLKKAVLPATLVSPTLPNDIELPRIPVAILQRRTLSAGIGAVEQGLVQWSDWPIEMATWETMETLQQMFPRAPAWGQAGPEAPGTVSSSTSMRPKDDRADGPHRGSRNRRPSKNVIGDIWV